MTNQEFKIKDLNSMTCEEMLWSLKKIPRHNMDLRTRTLLIGVIESLRNKIHGGNYE